MTQKWWLGLVCRNWTSLGGWVESPWFVEQGTGSGDVPYSEKEKQCQLFLFRVREREQLSIPERMCIKVLWEQNLSCNFCLQMQILCWQMLQKQWRASKLIFFNPLRKFLSTFTLWPWHLIPPELLFSYPKCCATKKAKFPDQCTVTSSPEIENESLCNRGITAPLQDLTCKIARKWGNTATFPNQDYFHPIT